MAGSTIFSVSRSNGGVMALRTITLGVWSTWRRLVMERRFEVRLEELLADAEVKPGLLRGVLPRLERFLEPFVGSLLSVEQRTNAQHYVQGLLSDLKS